MIKPDGVQRGLVGEIISRFEKKGFKLVAMKVMQASVEHLEKHYADLSSKGFFRGLVTYMASGPVCAYRLRWLGLDNDHLAEHLPLAGLGGGLLLGLDAAQAGDCEDARLLHFGSANLSEAGHELVGHGLLHLELRRKGIGNGTLGHGRDSLLHGGHDWKGLEVMGCQGA